MKKILVADVPQMDGRYSAALAGWEIAFVRTMAEARGALAASRYDLVAIGVYFDDSQMFDLVRAIRASRNHGEVPIICVRARTGFTAITTRTLEVALTTLGADQFIDLLHFGDDDGGNSALRSAAEGLVRD
jgi:DNA-binding response OmpR family regulator